VGESEDLSFDLITEGKGTLEQNFKILGLKVDVELQVRAGETGLDSLKKE
jgi:hypothetical protein